MCWLLGFSFRSLARKWQVAEEETQKRGKMAKSREREKKKLAP